MEPKERVTPRHIEHRSGSLVPQAKQYRSARILLLVALAMLCLGGKAQAQYWYPRHGYAWYPSYYGGGYYRAPFYGGGIPQTCGYYGCYARPAIRSGFGDYRQYHYIAPHHYYRTRHPRDAGGEFGVGW